MVQPNAAAQAKKAAEQAAQEAEEKKQAEERERRRTDTNYNPLLNNGITNKDVSTNHKLTLILYHVVDFPHVTFPFRHG